MLHQNAYEQRSEVCLGYFASSILDELPTCAVAVVQGVGTMITG